jgi:hypothetical protein
VPEGPFELLLLTLVCLSLVDLYNNTKVRQGALVA